MLKARTHSYNDDAINVAISKKNITCQSNDKKNSIKRKNRKYDSDDRKHKAGCM